MNIQNFNSLKSLCTKSYAYRYKKEWNYRIQKMYLQSLFVYSRQTSSGVYITGEMKDDNVQIYYGKKASS